MQLTKVLKILCLYWPMLTAHYKRQIWQKKGDCYGRPSSSLPVLQFSSPLSTPILHSPALHVTWDVQLVRVHRTEKQTGKDNIKTIRWRLHSNLAWSVSETKNTLRGAGMEQGWRSGENVRLPPIWPGFDFWTRCHMWVEFVVSSLLCSERFFSGYSGFPLSSKTNISKFQFDPECTDISEQVIVSSLVLRG